MVLRTRLGIDIHHRSFQYMFAGIFKLYFPHKVVKAVP